MEHPQLNPKVSFSIASLEYQKGEYRQALHTLNKLLDIQKDGKTYALLAKTFAKIGLRSDAASIFEVAASYDDAHSTEYRKQAMTLHLECGNEDEALVSGKRLFEKDPNDPDVAFVLATIFLKRGERDILEGLRKPLITSGKPEHIALAGQLLTEHLADENNYLTTQKVLQGAPGNTGIRSVYLTQARELNDYVAIEKHQPLLDKAYAKGDLADLSREHPWFNLNWCGDEKINSLSQYTIRAAAPETTALRRQMPHTWSDKIRIGYLSSDFWDLHATMKLLRNVLERHDRERFEITLFCYTPARLLERNTADRSTWGNVVSILDMSDEEAAATIRAHGIDILVEMKGHTKDARPGILSYPTAPVQVAWLGFPGSTLNVDLDYVIGDHYVLQDTSKPYYHEKFCRLPDTYQPNDPVNRSPLTPHSRAELGLPEDTFLFASFNNNRKISLEVINLWVKILKRAKNSSLLLLTTSERSRINIENKFESEGISPRRIIFTPKVSYEQHLNRLQAADVGLDTFPYNGHTTTSEQLWGGLPVIAMKGTNFASRVSESLLNAIGLPELVTADPSAYVKEAIACYENPDRVAGYKSKLAENRLIAPLFDSERFCRHLEMAYETMADRARNGLEPDHFDVPALPPRTTRFQ